MCPESVPAEVPDATPPAAETAAPGAEVRPPPGDGVGVRIGSFEILTSQRLRHLDQGPIWAFAARPLGHTSSATLFALIGEQWLIPRHKAMEMISNIANPNFIRIIHHGVVYWLPAKAERYVIIYENNLGQPLLRTHVGHGLGWKNE